MNKKDLKITQPVVYQTLSNALKRNRLAHAYLFEGDKSAPKLETAILFSQSLVCSHTDEDGFACQECDVCKRIAAKESIDFKWVDGISSRIKKNDVIKLQELFETTSLEEQNRRIYVLEGFDQATADASNSLLKFLEEPAEGIFGILIADEKSNVLPTIQSRCQWIHFRPASKLEIMKLLSEEYDEVSSKMLSESGYTLEKAREIIQLDEFEVIKKSALEYVDHLDSMKQVFKLQNEVFLAKSSLMKKEWIRLWLEWVLFGIKQNSGKLSLSKQVKIQTVLIESMDILRRPVDLALFLDKIYYEIREVVIK